MTGDGIFEVILNDKLRFIGKKEQKSRKTYSKGSQFRLP